MKRFNEKLKQQLEENPNINIEIWTENPTEPNAIYLKKDRSTLVIADDHDFERFVYENGESISDYIPIF